MEKKKWQNAKILELGVESTKVESTEDETNENAKIFFKCKYCDSRFWTRKGRREHEEICVYQTTSPGFGPDGDVMPGVDYISPIS